MRRTGQFNVGEVPNGRVKLVTGIASGFTSVPKRLVMLFYRYMLPCVTSEVYSWADPAEAIFGFKSGQENQTFVSWITFPPIVGLPSMKTIIRQSSP